MNHYLNWESYHIEGFLLLIEELKSVQARAYITFCDIKAEVNRRKFEEYENDSGQMIQTTELCGLWQ